MSTVAAKIASGAYQAKQPFPIMSTCVTQAEFQKKRVSHQNETTALLKQFQEDLEKEHCIKHVSRKKKDLLWKLAWDYGHNAGLLTVDNYYSELVELVR